MRKIRKKENTKKRRRNHYYLQFGTVYMLYMIELMHTKLKSSTCG
jgi:hypothetical protein